jgi:acetolactate synthase I/II/III large subunit
LHDAKRTTSALGMPSIHSSARAVTDAKYANLHGETCAAPCARALGAEKPALIEVMSDIGKDYPPYESHQPRQR